MSGIPSRKIRIAVSLALIAAAVAAVTGCSTASTPAATSGEQAPFSATMVLPTALSLTWAPELAAVQNELFGKGDKLTIETATGSAQALQLVAAGTADLTAVGPTDYLTAKARGGDLISFGIRKDEVPFHLVTPANRPVKSAKDLIGTTVGLASVGGTTEQLLDLYLRANNVDPAQVSRQAVGATAAAYQPVKSGQIQSVILNNSATSAVRATENVSVLDFQDVTPMAGTVYVARASDVAADPSKYARILEGFTKGAQAMVDDAKKGFASTIAVLTAQGVADAANAGPSLKLEVEDYANPVDLTSRASVWQDTVKTLKSGGFNSGNVPAADQLFVVPRA